jgi:hypothetical protein
MAGLFCVVLRIPHGNLITWTIVSHYRLIHPLVVALVSSSSGGISHRQEVAFYDVCYDDVAAIAKIHQIQLSRRKS